MGFEFEYRRPDSQSAPPRPPRRPGWRGLRQRIADLWRRMPRLRLIAVAVILILAASTVADILEVPTITSRDRGSGATLDEIAAAYQPSTDANPVPATSLQKTTLPSADPEPPPATTVAATLPPASPTVTATASDTRPPPPPSTAASEPSGAVDWSELALSVVYIEADECPSLPSRFYSSGSGTVVRGGAYVLTNAHVVYDDNGAPCRELVVWFTRSFEEEPDDWVRAALVAADRRLDLAVLQLEAPVSAARSVWVAAQQLEPGESIRILGYPGAGGLTMTLTRGSYSGMIDYEGEAYIKTDADISEGTSGGAAFDEAGVFIGVPTAGIEQVGLLIPAGVAERFLDRALES